MRYLLVLFLSFALFGCEEDDGMSGGIPIDRCENFTLMDTQITVNSESFQLAQQGRVFVDGDSMTDRFELSWEALSLDCSRGVIINADLITVEGGSLDGVFTIPSGGSVKFCSFFTSDETNVEGVNLTTGEITVVPAQGSAVSVSISGELPDGVAFNFQSN